MPGCRNWISVSGSLRHRVRGALVAPTSCISHCPCSIASTTISTGAFAVLAMATPDISTNAAQDPRTIFRASIRYPLRPATAGTPPDNVMSPVIWTCYGRRFTMKKQSSSCQSSVDGYGELGCTKGTINDDHPTFIGHFEALFDRKFCNDLRDIVRRTPTTASQRRL